MFKNAGPGNDGLGKFIKLGLVLLLVIVIVGSIGLML